MSAATTASPESVADPWRSFGISRREFVALMAAMAALNPLAIDIVLPAMQEIGAALGQGDANRRQWVIGAYLLGMAAPMLIYGPLSDWLGRRVPLFFGLVVYVVATIGSMLAGSFTAMLFWRFLQGIGSSAPRVLVMAIQRDRVSGSELASMFSLVMMVFMLAPILAPALGQGLLLLGNWRIVFAAMALLSALVLFWAVLRLPETHHARPAAAPSLAQLLGGFAEVLRQRGSLLRAAALACLFGALFGMINSAQQIYVEHFHLGARFPLAFAGMAGLMAFSSWLNARWVQRFGAQRLLLIGLMVFTGISGLWSLTAALVALPLWLFLCFLGILMLCFGFIPGNLNSLALMPLGQRAGTAVALFSCLQTFVGALIGGLIGLAFNGTTLPLACGFALTSLTALALTLAARHPSPLAERTP